MEATKHPGGRNGQQGLVAWLRRTRTNTAVAIPWRETTLPAVIVSDPAAQSDAAQNS